MVPKIRLIRVIIEHLVFISSRGLLITEMICTKIQTKKREKNTLILQSSTFYFLMSDTQFFILKICFLF